MDTFRIFGKLVAEQRCSLTEGGRNTTTVEGNYSITREHKKILTQHELNRGSPKSRVQSRVQILYYAVQPCYMLVSVYNMKGNILA